MQNKHFIGIDLGTTNCSVAISNSDSSNSAPKNLPISQIAYSGLRIESEQMPSAIYIPVSGEILGKGNDIPWQKDFDVAIGAYAKDRAGEVPDRIVLSAKSWLCQANVDRKEKILPWQSEISESKISPFEASITFLKYLKNSLENFLVENGQENKEDYSVVVTVPASFDEAARNLTIEAAESAGFQEIGLLEEPLAALYSWVANKGESWREYLGIGDIILVCDIGGGTADFSLISVGEEQGNLSLERLSVGNHLLLGGDNMDLAIAYNLKNRFESSGKALDTWQFQALTQQSRIAKERMLSSQDSKLPVAIAGRGSSLFSSTLKLDVERNELLQIVVEGFFPMINLEEARVEADNSALAEYGLPFESEPALSKHLGQFLKQSSKQIQNSNLLPQVIKDRAQNGVIVPDRILFNGGVTSSRVIRDRVLELLRTWGASHVTELTGTNLNTAVSEGASYFSKVKATGSGIKIKAGVPRSYYIGLKTSGPAVPGFKASTKGLCVVPQGMEEGSSTPVSEQKFSLLTGQEVQFQLYTSKERGEDIFGVIVENADNLLEKSVALKIKLEADSGDLNRTSKIIPVQIFSSVNNLGLLEVWMQSTDSVDRWKLEFDVRSEKKTLIFNDPQTSTQTTANF